MGRDDTWIDRSLDVTGRVIIGFLDTILIAASLALMTIAAVTFLVGVSGFMGYSVEFGWIGGVVTLGALTLLLGWGFSRRLTIMNRQIMRMRSDLDELLRRTQP